MFNLDGERLSQRLELVISLHLVLGKTHEVEFSIVSSELDVGQFNVDVVTVGIDMKFTSDIEGASEVHIIHRTSLGRNVKVVNVFLSRSEKVVASISLNESGAAEHQTCKLIQKMNKVSRFHKNFQKCLKSKNSETYPAKDTTSF